MAKVPMIYSGMYWKRRNLLFLLLLTVGCGQQPFDNPVSVDASSHAESEAKPVEDNLHPTPMGTYPDSASQAQKEALFWINTFRVKANLPPVHELKSLNIAAEGHAKYVLEHADMYEKHAVSVHEQVPNTDGYTGSRFWERMKSENYPGKPFREVIAYQAKPSAAVAHWMETVYHRLPILHPSARHVGYAQKQKNGSRINVLDMGAGAGKPKQVSKGIAWPPQGATDVPLSWDGLENPQPPAPATGYPSGPIVTLSFSEGTELRVSSHRLIDITGGTKDLDHVHLTPQNDPHLKGDSTIAIYANDPLQPGHTYQVIVTGTLDGKEFSRTWRFTTRKNPGCGLIEQDCGAGKACYGTSDADARCAWAGIDQPGDTCEFQNDCAVGHTCAGGRCTAYCSTANDSNQHCDDVCPKGFMVLNASDNIGACAR